eukprot:5692247-Prymnesium_polylepis.1
MDGPRWIPLAHRDSYPSNPTHRSNPTRPAGSPFSCRPPCLPIEGPPPSSAHERPPAPRELPAWVASFRPGSRRKWPQTHRRSPSHAQR